MVGDDDKSLPVPRQWPADEVLDPATAIAIDCPGCGSPWRVHQDLVGFRLRCACGTWIRMPPRTMAVPELPPPIETHLPTTVELARDHEGRIQLALRAGEITETDLPLHVSMAPGTVEHANVQTRQRWTN